MKKLQVAMLSLLITGCGGGVVAVQPTSTPAPPTATVVVASPTVASAPATSVPTQTPAIARPTTTPAARVENVDIRDNHFIPSELTIPVGTRVQWANNGENIHDVVANDRSFSSNSLSTGARFTFTFQTRGRYEYFCTPHMAEGMVGVIVVE